MRFRFLVLCPLLAAPFACGPTAELVEDAKAHCSIYADEEAASTLTVRVRNDGDAPVFIDTDCGAPIFSVNDENGEQWRSSYSCVQTCETLQTEEQHYCGVCLNEVVLVAPGGTVDLTWRGSALRSEVMEASCWFESGSEECVRERAAPAGAYDVSVVGHSQCEGPCDCTGSDDQCEGIGAGVTATAQTLDVSWPSESLVEVVFEPCALGCAGG